MIRVDSKIKFDLNLFDSFDRLQSYFLDPVQLEKIRTIYSENNYQITSEGYKPSRQFKIIKLSSFLAFNTIFYYFSCTFKELSFLFCHLNLIKTSHRYFRNNYLHSRSKVLGFLRYDANFLTSCINAPKFKPKFFKTSFNKTSFAKPSIEITDREILSLLKKDKKVLEFSFDGGVCRGMCEFFIYLYISLKDEFLKKEDLLLSITKSFENGSRKRSSLLQKFIHGTKLLNLETDKKLQFFTKNLADGVTRKVFDEKVFSDLENGIYEIDLYKISGDKTSAHACLIIKESHERFYVFDPNIGLFKFFSKDTIKDVLNYFSPQYIDGDGFGRSGFVFLTYSNV
jgi:hypothetical protein